MELRGRKWQRDGKKYIIGDFIICTVLMMTKKVKKIRKMKSSGNTPGQSNICKNFPRTHEGKSRF